MPRIVYIGSYADTEREDLARRGIAVDVWDGGGARPVSQEQRAIVRGPRLSPADYADLYDELLSAGLMPRTTPESYALLADSGGYGAALPGMVPEKRVLFRSDNTVAGLSALKHWGRAFIRSELGSAAKASGTEACMLETFERSEIAARLETLRSAYPAARQVIASKVEAIRTVDGANAEGRFIVLDGALAYLDHCELSGSDDVQLFERNNRDRAQAAIDALSRAGARGDYFLDIAETAAGGWFVVEIKPLLNGTIRKLDRFAAALTDGA